jgi:hypothetical protein
MMDPKPKVALTFLTRDGPVPPRFGGADLAFETFMLAGGIAVMLGLVAARMMRVLGLVLLLLTVIAAGVVRIVLFLPHPSLLECLMLLALVQAGYLLGVLAFGEPEVADTEHPAPSAPPNHAITKRAIAADDTATR